MQKKTKGIPLTLSCDNDKIYFKAAKGNVMAVTDFKANIYSELLKANWYIKTDKKKNYVYTGSTRWGKAKKLHQVIMFLWYGEKVFQESLKNKIVIDHLDNEEYNNLIENLAFAPKNHNTAKGLIYDKESKKLKQKRTIVHWYKDFNTGEYQFIIIFNDDAYIKNADETNLIDRIYLIYEDNYRIIYQDASSIVGDLLDTGEVDLKKLRYKGEPHIIKTVLLDPSKIKEGQAFAYDDKGNLVLLKSDKVELISVARNPELHNKSKD